MNKKPEERRSLIHTITEIAKLLRVQVKKKPPLVSATLSISPPFVKGVEQIVRLLRVQARQALRAKQRTWRVVRRSDALPKPKTAKRISNRRKSTGIRCK